MSYVLHEGSIDSGTDNFDQTRSFAITPAFDLTVLLVEDIPINMQVARHMLTRLGCRVVEALNGRDALERIEEQDFDVVLMDCQMPVMDGYSATRVQRERERKSGAPRLPIIALTANALDEDRQRCLEAGMDDFISKPFSRTQLREALQNLVDGDGENVTETIVDELTRPANDPVVDDDAVIDRGALQQIAELDPEDDGDLVESIIDSYVENAEVLMLELSEAADQQDLESAVRAAHSLKSSSANVGARRFSGLCATMERGGRQGNVETIAANIDKAWQEHERAVAELLNCKTETAA